MKTKHLFIVAIIMIIALLSSCNQTETITCGACGSNIPVDAIFCTKCGSSVTTETTLATEATQGAENTDPSHVHAWSAWTTTLEATCTAEGNQERSCSCGEKETQSIATVDHTEIVDEAVAATCEKEGKTEGKHCMVCSIIIVSQESTSKIEHIESSWITDKAATKTEDGARHTECTMCKKVMSEEVLYATGSVGLAYGIYSDGKTCTITGIGTCTDSNVIIPKVIDEYQVIAIAARAFYECTTIIEITIPETVTRIGMQAFELCGKLKSITIPNSVTSIDIYAFNFCTSLTSITIPDSVTSISGGAFSQCTSLTSIIIPDSVTSISGGAFSYCTSLTSITIPDTVTSISEGAFHSCKSLTSITISDSVTIIGDKAFYDCTSLKDVYYTGTEAEWKAITIRSYNSALRDATIHYNSKN